VPRNQRSWLPALGNQEPGALWARMISPKVERYSAIETLYTIFSVFDIFQPGDYRPK
jgi:hypothetical protein